MANASSRKTKRYMAILLAGILTAMSFAPPVSAEPELYTSSENFEYNGGLTDGGSPVQGKDGVFSKISNDGKATLYWKHDGSNTISDRTYYDLRSGRSASITATSANGGAFLEYEFNELLTGQVTISFQATGGTGAGVNPRWQILDDQGNVILFGGSGNNAFLGSNADMECVYCDNGIHQKGHNKSDGTSYEKDHMSGNGHSLTTQMGWYKMHLDFDNGVATFEEKFTTSGEEWKTFYGYAADGTKSDPYVMALGSTRGAKKIRFNFSGTAATTTAFVADTIEVKQTAFATPQDVLTKRAAIISAAKTQSDQALVDALTAGIDAVDDSLAATFSNYNADQKGYVADYVEANRPSSVPKTPADALKELTDILAVPIGRIETIIGLNTKTETELFEFLASNEATVLLTPASLAAYNNLNTTGGKQRAVAALLEAAATNEFKMPADVSAALLTAVGIGEAYEEYIAINGGRIIAAAKTLSDEELVAALDADMDVVSPVLEATYGAYNDDQKEYVADYVEENRPTATDTVAALEELANILAVPVEHITTVVGLQAKTDAQVQDFLVSAEAEAMLTPVSLAAYNNLTIVEKPKAVSALLAVATDFKVPTDVSAALILAANAAAQLDPNETYIAPVPTFVLENGAKNVHPDQPLHISFTPGVDSSNLTGFVLETLSGTPVAITASASYDGTDVVVKPNSSLAANTTYILTIPEGTINSAVSSSIKAKGAVLTFSTGANDGIYQEENFNRFTYGSTNTWDIINGLQTESFDGNSAATIMGTSITDQTTYEAAVSGGVLDNGNGFNLKTNGSVSMVQTAAAGVYKKSSFVIDFADVSSGRLQIGFDLILESNPSLENSDGFIKINNMSSIGSTGMYYKFSHSKDKVLNVASSVEKTFGDTPMIWTREDGTEASQGETLFTAGHYKFMLDIDIDNGTADVNIVKTKTDGSVIYGHRSTTPRPGSSGMEPIGQIVFDVLCQNAYVNENGVEYNFYTEALDGDMKQYAYGLDNVFVRSFPATAAPKVEYNGATTDVALTANPVLSFATPVTEAAAAKAITVTDKRGNKVSFTGSMDAAGLAYTIIPTGGLVYNNSTYTINFAGCKDWAGKAVPEATFTFTTVPDAGYEGRRTTLMNAAVNESGTALISAIDTAISDVNDKASMSYENYNGEQKKYVAGYVEANRPADGDFASLGTTLGEVVDALDAVEALSTADRAGMSDLLATPEKRAAMMLSAEASNAYNALDQTQKDNTIIALAPLVPGVITPEQASSALLSAIATATAPQPVITPSTNHTGIVSGGGGNWGSVNVQVTDKVLAENTNTALPQGNNAFNDLGTVSWARNAINILASHGIISGRGDGSFGPSDSVTREEFLKMALQAFEVYTISEGTLPFKDVSMDSWYYPVVSLAYETGIVGGVSSDAFGVGAPITRQDMALILSRVLNYQFIELKADTEIEPFTDSDSFSTNEAKEAIDTLAKGGIINGREDGSFDPIGTATRAEAAAVIYRVLYRVGLL
ncbi:MAG: S-layer homology domain-containing protein [Clostridia bacterium]|nr:S-layer homology domain-containing protein [Clostridia bacterium]